MACLSSFFLYFCYKNRSKSKLNLRGKEIVVVCICVSTAVFIMSNFVVCGKFYIGMQIIVEPNRMATERAIGTVGINGKLFVTIGWFKCW